MAYLYLHYQEWATNKKGCGRWIHFSHSFQQGAQGKGAVLRTPRRAVFGDVL
jgi:hypothetical protein